MNGKKLIFKILLLILPIIVLFFFIEFELSKIPNTYSKKRAGIERCKDSIETLFLGSSQTLLGINPSNISGRSFNLADYGQPIYYDKELSLKYLPVMPKLKLLVITINYITFYYSFEHSPTPWAAYYYSRFWNIPAKIESSWDIRKYSLLALYSPYVVATKYATKLFKVDLAENMNAYGFQVNDTNITIKHINDDAGLTALEHQNNIIDSSSFNQQFLVLDELMNAIQKRNIKVVFLSLPELPCYIDKLDSTLCNKTLKTINYFCQKYHTIYYDYTTDLRFNEVDFSDCNHLNYIGAGKFSRIIDTEVIQKELR